ncbi:2-oxo-hept-4-ene-1,7-dioate hydratase [Cupriavidus basilensis]|uniref:2-oxo-hept-4-ene-1,7-dioate hydratase n=1 Tax=Cupriavidus basilensis TaxID=68895 RepID=UPI00157AC1AC|nr:2-oxo-hepta-3-ene-1,7-dioic acid hydratase [Cupriavidus basilensis]NUA26920.1 2-oxo-hepta-3-ene-1,7-dioic acid hydratase [Cupriavidus basilensis]
MLTPEIVQRLAAELHASEKNRSAIEQFSKRYPAMTIEDGYAISRAWVAAKIADGQVVKGHKIGLTSRAMQISSQISEPDYGTLLDSMFFAQGDIPVDRFIAPRVEVELAFILGRPLRGPNLTIFDVLQATEYVTPAIEIIDSRIEQFDRVSKAPRKVFDTISDNAANAGIVLGGRPVRPDAVDLRWVSALLCKNAVIEESGVAAAVLNHPATGVAWLANKLAPWDEHLAAGEVVLAGSFTRPVAAAAGDSFHVDYGPLGAVAFRFV